jgi:hypothetical protein
MKKTFALFILAALISGGAFAQAGSVDNWISGQVSLLGSGAQYERVLTPQFSVGANVYFNSLFLFWNNFGLKAYGRFYPWKSLFLEMGLGYGFRTGTGDYEYQNTVYDNHWYRISGFLMEPGVGWKIDVGNPGGFFIEPVITVPIVLGTKKYDILGWDSGSAKFGIGATVRAAFGMGYAF